MSVTQELPLDLRTQYAFATPTAAVSTASLLDYRPQQRKEKKVQRTRKAFSSLQLDQLKCWFQQNQYPSRKETAELASSLGLTAFQVKTWFRNRRNKNDKLDFECKKMTTEVMQDVGGSLGILQVGGNTSLAAQPQQQELEYYGLVGHNQLTSHHKDGEGYYPQMQQQMEEAVVAANNYVYYMTYISHYTAYMNQAHKGS